MKYQIINKILREKIFNHPSFQLLKTKNFEELKEEMIKLGRIGCIVLSRPHIFLLILQQLEILDPNEIKIKEELISYYNMKGNKYVLILLAFYVKLSCKYDEYKILKLFLNDYRKIIIINKNNEVEVTNVDIIIEDLLLKNEYLGLFLYPFGKKYKT